MYNHIHKTKGIFFLNKQCTVHVIWSDFTHEITDLFHFCTCISQSNATRSFLVNYSRSIEANATFLIHQWSVFVVHFPFPEFSTPRLVVLLLSQPMANTKICDNQYCERTTRTSLKQGTCVQACRSMYVHCTPIIHVKHKSICCKLWTIEVQKKKA